MSKTDIDNENILTILKDAKGEPKLTSEIHDKLTEKYRYENSITTVRRKLKSLEKLQKVVRVLHPRFQKNAWIHECYNEKKLRQININFDPIIKVLMKDIERLEDFFNPMILPKLKAPSISLHFEKKADYSLFKKYIRDLLEKDPTLFEDPFKEIEELKKMELKFYELRRNITKEIDSLIQAEYPKIAKDKDERLGLIELLSLRLKDDIVGGKYDLIPDMGNMKKTSNEEWKIFKEEWVETNPEGIEEFLNSDITNFLLKKTPKDNIYEELLKKVKKSPYINEKRIKELWLIASNAEKRISNIVKFLEIFPLMDVYS